MTVLPGGTLTFGGLTLVGEGGFTSNEPINVKVLDNAYHMQYTLNGDAKLGKGRVLQLDTADVLLGEFKLTGENGAKIVCFRQPTNNKWKIDQVDASNSEVTHDDQKINGPYTYEWDETSDRWAWTDGASPVS